MAIYTHLSFSQVEEHLKHYHLGELVDFRGIQEGIENTNYLLQIRDGHGKIFKAILTLFEQRVRDEDLPFFMNLKAHLNHAGCHCPTAYVDEHGALISSVAGKSAALIWFLEGEGVKQPHKHHIQELGREMARMHLAVGDFSQQRVNSLAPDRLCPLYDKISSHLDKLGPGLQSAIAKELEIMERWQSLNLPQGVIHADLFPDNVFFKNGKLSGVIDFYFACTEYLAYDLAICLNAWCFNADWQYNEKFGATLLESYEQLRLLNPDERQKLTFLARGAALRFLMTRAHDWFFRVEGAVVTPKDPMEYLAKWRYWCQQ